jgi:arylsulfatase A
MKLHTTDAGFRVAGIMNWPAAIGSNVAVVGTPVSALDFLPTFCELAGVELGSDLKLDGISFLPLLRGESLARSKPLVWAYYNALNESRVAMRDGPWKVLAKLNGGKLPRMQNVTREQLPNVRDAQLTDIEIYNLGDDIGETKNLARTNPELTTKLRTKLEEQYRELADDSHAW